MYSAMPLSLLISGLLGILGIPIAAAEAITKPAATGSIMDHLDSTTITSLLAVLLILGTSYAVSLRVLAPSTAPRFRILFIWHAFDFLIHTIFEGDRVFGAAYGDNWATKLWMVYAQADRRWAQADLTVISLELLTVFLAGPLAAWICYGIAKRDWRVSFWMVVLATGEIYGGFMTFAPEWLTGNLNLDGSNFMFMWVYLVFFNMLWVFIPLYALWVAFQDMGNAFRFRDGIMALGQEGHTTFSITKEGLDTCQEGEKKTK
ncbi:Emopamil-binding protein-like [Lachnellula hyalina]|uniref:Emopamil-binding protein-like n=1 Tax=Lachnellula hyalina TaxID=1316788 RepID=A0A8H8R3M3_9HELO|nr:Emopamil-binding protein-like [Lachnellula hyalina]TVY27095.1 Emopamil-binding protein-like [Lachnellula hyalina]